MDTGDTLAVAALAAKPLAAVQSNPKKTLMDSFKLFIRIMNQMLKFLEKLTLVFLNVPEKVIAIEPLVDDIKPGDVYWDIDPFHIIAIEVTKSNQIKHNHQSCYRRSHSVEYGGSSDHQGTS